MEKKTKIVATVSDLKCDVEFIEQLYEAGINVVRLNTAHQTEEDTLRVIENVRKVSKSIALLLDTKGPEIRTAKTDFVYQVNRGDKVIVKGDSSKITDEKTVYVSHDNFVAEVEAGQKILIDDGELELSIIKKEGESLVCEATNSGEIKGKKSVNVPKGTFSLPALTEGIKIISNLRLNMISIL
jgi:pyruvate kinase